VSRWGWLSEAAGRIGTTLDLPATAREVTEVAVPALAGAAAVFVAERLLAADEPASYEAGPVAVVRRLVARLGGQSAADTDGLLRPGEVVVLGGDSLSLRTPGRPGGRELTSGYASFLAAPLVARGVVLGCVTFGRADRVRAAARPASRCAACPGGPGSRAPLPAGRRQRRRRGLA